jgi:hypothetical protein
MKRLLPYLFLLSCAVSFADSSLNLLQGKWTESCHPTTNEAGTVIETGPFRSLQSSYSQIDKDHVYWIVSSFKDQSCKVLYDENRYELKCQPTNSSDKMHCVQTTWEARRDGSAWVKKNRVDHAGYPNTLRMTIALKTGGPNKLELTTTNDESEEPRTVVLSK